jgi:predicted phosphodiesterase
MEKRKEITLLLISDIHLGRHGSDSTLRELKRILDRHADVADQILFPGDFANGSKDSEYGALSEILSGFPYEKVSVVPGNHDIAGPGVLVPSQKRRVRNKKRFMDCLGRFLPENGRDDFPYLKIVGDIAIVGLNTIPSVDWRRPYTLIQSAGIVGAKQTEKLSAILASEEVRGKWIIVLMHHDPYNKRRKDPAPFVAKKGFRLFLESAASSQNIILVCGHNHNCAIEKISGNLMHVQTPSLWAALRRNEKHYLKLKIMEKLEWEELA